MRIVLESSDIRRDGSTDGSWRSTNFPEAKVQSGNMSKSFGAAKVKGAIEEYKRSSMEKVTRFSMLTESTPLQQKVLALLGVRLNL